VSALGDVLGTLLLVAAALSGWVLLTRQGPRSGRLRWVLARPGGFGVRNALLTAAVGVWWLARGWVVTGVELVLMGWQAGVLVPAGVALLVRRARQRRAA
jgi:hypothetical protein